MKRLFPGTGAITLLLLIINIPFLQAQKGLTLDDAMRIAGSNSPSVKKARLNLVISRENLNAQKASLKTSMSLSVNPLNYIRYRTFSDLISKWNSVKTAGSNGLVTISQPILFTDAKVSLVNNFGYTNSYSEYSDITTKGFYNNLYLTLDQPLFTYNKTKLQLKELELALENSQLSYAVQQLSLEKDVALGFYNVYQQQKSLEIARQALENMQKSYLVSKSKVDAGISPREELFQAEINFSTAKSDVADKEVSLENAKDEFKLLIGMTLYDDFIVLPDISIDTVKVDIAFAIDQGLANRMELRQRAIDVENSQFDLIKTKALNEFKGDIGLSIGLFGDNKKVRDIYSNPTDNESIALSLTIPLWDWGEKKSRIKASKASIETEKLGLEAEQNSIILNIRQVCRNLINLKNQIEIARRNAENAKITYNLNLVKYKNGDLSGIELNIYQNQLSEKQLSYTTFLISCKLELLNLKIQTLYDFEKNTPVAAMKDNNLQ